MRTMFKYPLPLTGCIITIPLGADIKHMDVQANRAFIWAEVDPSVEESVKIQVQPIVTGGVVPEEMLYIGTALLDAGEYVLHYYITEVI